MVLVLVAVVVVAVLAVAVFLRLRPRGGDLDSVRSYHAALGTLEHLGERSGPPSVRVNGVAGRAADSEVRPRIDAGRVGAPTVPPVPVRDSDEFPDPGDAPLVFDDSPGPEGPRSQPPHEWVGPLRADRAQRHALESMNHRPRRATWVLVTVLVLALFAGLAYSGSRRSKSAGHAPSATTVVTTAAASHPARSTSSTGGSHDTQRSGEGRHAKPAGTKAPVRIVAASTTLVSATYPVLTSGPYQVAVSASAPCWVEAKSVTTGATLWTGLMVAGGHQVIPATGPVTLELGALGVSLTVDQVPVVLPTPMRTPFVATFQPLGQGSSASSSTGTASTGTASTGTASTGTASSGTASSGTASDGTASTVTTTTASGSGSLP